MKRYDGDFRSKVLGSILEGDLGVYEAATRYGITNTTIYRWLDAIENKTTGMRKKSAKDQKSQAKPNDLSKELARLKEELRLERLRSQAYQEMIKHAEAYFNISIEKKSGSKQSKK